MAERRPTVSWLHVDDDAGDAAAATDGIAAWRAGLAAADRDAAYETLLGRLRDALADLCEHPALRTPEFDTLLLDLQLSHDLETLNRVLDRMSARLRGAGNVVPLARLRSAQAADPRPTASPQRLRLWL